MAALRVCFLPSPSHFFLLVCAREPSVQEGKSVRAVPVPPDDLTGLRRRSASSGGPLRWVDHALILGTAPLILELGVDTLVCLLACCSKPRETPFLEGKEGHVRLLVIDVEDGSNVSALRNGSLARGYLRGS